jgi:hypothetical protein
MSDSYLKIFEGSECPSHQMLQDYIDGKLSGKDKHMVEKHLIDCEMCSDELEGLSYLKDKNKLEGIVDEIKDHSHRKNNKTIRLFTNYRFVASAAVFLILAAIVVILQLNNKKENVPLVAEQTETVSKGDEEKERKREDIIVAEEPELIEKEEKVIAKELPPKPQRTIIEVVEDDVESDDIIYESEIDADAGIEEVPAMEDEVVVSQDIIVESKREKGAASKIKQPSKEKIQESDLYKAEGEIKEVTTITSRETKNAVSVSTEELHGLSSKRAASTDFGKAMEKFNAEKYKAAARMFSNIVKNDSTNFRAMYYAALSYKETNDNEKAIELLDKIIEDKHNAHLNDALTLKKEILKE